MHFNRAIPMILSAIRISGYITRAGIIA